MNSGQMKMTVSDDVVAGHWADFVHLWHTRDMFVLDFSALVRPPYRDEEEGVVVTEARVVTRVRVPPSQVFEIMKAMEQQLSAWEREVGAVRPPGDPAAPDRPGGD